MKKMTQKEFWQVLEDATGITRDAFGYDGILNRLAGLHWDSADNARRKGGKVHTDYAELQDKRAKRIYDALDARGYYDDCRK